MLPTFSSAEDVKMGFKMHHSPILPPFTPRSKIRTTSQNRGFSPMKQSRAVERFPPLKNPESWKDVIDEVYPPTTAPVISASAEQYKCFQSTTILRSVPIMRRHLDNFGGRTFSLPAKTKPVPFHTGRFIYDPTNRPMLLEDLTQNQRLQAEMAMIEKVRGLKRKREALGHRWGWRKFKLNGMEVAKNERFNIQAEVQKLKELILPPTARDIYTGRGIRLPETHHTMRGGRASPEAPFPPPPSAWMPQDESQKPHTTFAARQFGDTASKTGGVRTSDLFPFRQSAPGSTNYDGLMVQSVPVPGYAVSPTPVKPPEDGAKDAPQATIPPPEPAPVMKMHEPVEQIEVIEPDSTVPDYSDQTKDITAASPMVPDTPVDRSRSMAAPSASPDGKAHNPLVSLSALEDSVTSTEETQSLRDKFTELDTEGKGHLTFEQTTKVFPTELTQCQSRFLRSFYDIVTQSQTFGPDEFIAMTSLAHKLINMSPAIQEMFEQINFATLEESITQYTELFASVDRTGRGRIGFGALLQLLSTTLQRQLEPDTRLAQQIMETMQKEYAGEVPRIEFLSFIPYFLYLEEMT